MDSKINTKGQVTIFVILGILLVVTIVLLFMSFRPGSVTPDVSASKSPQQYIEIGVRESLAESIEPIVRQGGYLNPTNFKLYEDNKISYLCYNANNYQPCINQEPLLIEHIEEEIEENIREDVENYFIGLIQDLENDNYEVVDGPMSLNVELVHNRVLVDMLRKSKKQFLRIPINNVDHSLLGKIKYKLTGRRKNPQSTSTIANSLLHDAFIEEYMKSILHNLSDNSDRIDSNHIDLVYGKMQSNLKSQLVFRVLFSFDYIQRLCKTV